MEKHMKFWIILLVVALTAHQSNAQTYGDAEFCSAMKELSETFNKDAPTWVDSTTRHDGMAVLCNAKIAEYKKFIKVTPAEFRDGWQQRKQAQWNSIYCDKEKPFREAIDNGWQIVANMTFIDGSIHRITAECSN